MKYTKITVFLNMMVVFSVVGCAESHVGDIDEKLNIEEKNLRKTFNPVAIVTIEKDLINEGNKNKVKFDNYTFTYIVASAIAYDIVIKRIKVLVKNQKVVSILNLYTSELPPAIIVTPLTKALDIKLAMDVIYGKEEASTYNNRGFPKTVEEGYSYLIFSNYEEVDKNYVLNLEVELVKELHQNYKKWKKYSIDNYKLTYYSTYSKIDKYDKYYRERKIEENWMNQSGEVFLSMDNLFQYLEDKLINSSCQFAIAYHKKYAYPEYVTKYCKGKKIYRNTVVKLELEEKEKDINE